MTWNPQLYLQYESERLRPALDLIARIPLAAPATIVDLGCGAGNVARVLGDRWPDARVCGVDSSAAMLAKARTATGTDARYTFVEADLAVWAPPAPVDLVFSNAALHWLPDHAHLFARVAAMVAPGGVLAVQMPDNFSAPSHASIAEIARGVRWRDTLAHRVRADPVATAADYFRWLSPHVTRLDMWTTEYLQVLPASAGNEHPVATWTRATWLAPLLEALDEDEQREFLDDYGARLAIGYPPLADGRVLFPFRRLFIVANR